MTKPGRYTKEGLIRSNNLASKPGKAVKLPDKLENEQEKEKWLQQMHDPSQTKIIDLFCGAGGMSEGFVNQGLVVAAALDYNKDACKTFAANIPAKVLCADISKIDDPGSILEEFPDVSIDVIVGGPPCQGFSIVGQARIRSLDKMIQQEHLARNELYQQYFRFIEKFCPFFFVMENVPAMLSFGEGAYIKAIQQECDRLGYFCDIQSIDASEYGVPQVRRRVIVVGSRAGKLFRWPRTIAKEYIVPLKDAIGDLPAVQPPAYEECLQYSPEKATSVYQKLMRSRVDMEHKKFIYDHVVRAVREDDKEIFSQMKPGDRYIDIDEKYHRYNAKTFIDKYYMLKPDIPGVTITAHMAKDGYRYIHWDNQQHRTLSVREAARIQSFGDHFRFTGSRSSRFRQIGNAVPPLLAEVIANQINFALQRVRNRVFDETIQWGLPGYEQWSTLIEGTK